MEIDHRYILSKERGSACIESTLFMNTPWNYSVKVSLKGCKGFGDINHHFETTLGSTQALDGLAEKVSAIDRVLGIGTKILKHAYQYGFKVERSQSYEAKISQGGSGFYQNGVISDDEIAVFALALKNEMRKVLKIKHDFCPFT